MRKAPSNLQDLRRRIYRKAKSDKTHRFWGIFVHVTKVETLEEAYRNAKGNGGAPGIDGQSFEDIEQAGLTDFLAALREDLVSGRYEPKPNRRVDIPKGNGKVRTLQIPCIRDRVVQGALKLILEAIFEADFCPNSYGFRPRRSPHRALAEVRRSVLRRMSTVIDVDLSRYFDTIRHSVLLDKIAKRVQDPQVLHLVKQILKVGGEIGVPQGGPFSPLAANIYLNEVDWAFDAIRCKTAQGPYEAVNYHRFADDIVITRQWPLHQARLGRTRPATTPRTTRAARRRVEQGENQGGRSTERRSLWVPRIRPASRLQEGWERLLHPHDPEEESLCGNQGKDTRHHSTRRGNPREGPGEANQCHTCRVGELLPGRPCESHF